MKLEIEITGVSEYQLIEEAFLAEYRVEKDSNGNDLLTPSKHIELHVQNYIRGVVETYLNKTASDQAAQKLKGKLLFSDNLRGKVLDVRNGN